MSTIEKLRAVQSDPGINAGDFYAHMPSGRFIFEPTGELWPGSSVDKRLGKGTAQRVANERPVEQLTWAPSEPRLVRDRLMVVSGWRPKKGARAFNQYRPPVALAGNAEKAGRWLDHVRKVYPDAAEHIVRWLAHHVQRPGAKVNHALVLGGVPGIGKDTLLEPVVAAVGPWNWSDITPVSMIGRFNGWAKAVVVRVNEGRDLGDVDRFAFYEHSKSYITAPPAVLRVDEKNLREHYVVNACGVIVTTNHLLDGLYLPADDRRHYVAWSQLTPADFKPDYFTSLYKWFAEGGDGHVGALLRTLDLSGFNAKAPPVKTPAFWQIVNAGEAPERGELRDVLEAMGNPDVLTVGRLVAAARRLHIDDLADDLEDRRGRRTLPYRLGRAGYVSVHNPDSVDEGQGLYRIAGRRVAVYARAKLTPAEQFAAAKKLARED